MPKFSNITCKWNGIIIVKLFLKDILPDVDQILYLDSDMINVWPIRELWDINLKEKLLAGSPKIWYDHRWINSGVIMYNLENLRKQPMKLWKCANKKTCFIDDIWHTYCINRSLLFDLPYRYNVDLKGFTLLENRTKVHINEEKNVRFFHLMNNAKRIYSIRNPEDIPKMSAVRGIDEIAQAFVRIFDTIQWVRKFLKLKK